MENAHCNLHTSNTSLQTLLGVHFHVQRHMSEAALRLGGGAARKPWPGPLPSFTPVSLPMKLGFENPGGTSWHPQPGLLCCALGSCPSLTCEWYPQMEWGWQKQGSLLRAKGGSQLCSGCCQWPPSPPSFLRLPWQNFFRCTNLLSMASLGIHRELLILHTAHGRQTPKSFYGKA